MLHARSHLMANPLACAVALESLNQPEQQDWRTQVQRIESGLKQDSSPLVL